MAKLTPMLKQYRGVKARYPDAIVLFRLGDFYEMFEEDARTAARELGLVLTSRRFSKEVKLPMCGVPHHRLTSCIGRLIERGHKVAIVEQLEDARKVKRLVKRDVVRVITPGTVVEDALLREVAENFLAAIALGVGRSACPESFGLAMVDLSTGEFATTQIDAPEALTSLLEELGRAQPSEYVLPASLIADESFVARLQAIRPARLSPLDDTHFNPGIARERLLGHFGVASLEAYGCDDLPLATAAAGAALHYLKENQISDLAHLNRLTTYSLSQYMTLDGTTRRNLELTQTLRDGSAKGSLFWVLDQTMTAMGARLLRRWINQPLLDLTRIQERLDAVEELVAEVFLRVDLRKLLDGLHDVERLVGRIGFGSANARDLVALKRALERLPRVKRLLGKAHGERLRCLEGDLDELQDVAGLIDQAIVDDPPIYLKEGGLIRPGYDREVERLRCLAAEGRDWLTELEERERECTGIKNLRIRYNEVFGFFIEVTKSYLHLVPADYERRATITHAERFVTPELKAREGEILAAEERIKELEYDLFVGVRRQVAAHSARLQKAARILAELDVLASLAEAAARYSYVKPQVDEGGVIDIREGRHPVVERTLPEGQRFVPNDARLEAEGGRLLVITGPNMSGKSVYIRQVALIVLMAQMGSFVPAASAQVGLVDRIFTRVGATDDISQGRSTFLVEMSETSYILHHATPRSLIILDEVGRGTSTYDGMSIAWAVAEDIHNVIGAKTLFATHYHELTALAERGEGMPGLSGVRNYTMAVKEQGGEVIFLYRLVEGRADKSYGIQVARLAGLPGRVVDRAQEVLVGLEETEAPRAEGLRALPFASLTARELKEVSSPGPGSGRLLLPVDDEGVWEVIRELFGLDIANMTPVEALVELNDLQQRLRALL